MATQETLLKNTERIAERRRSEPGELHPHRKVHMQCKECGKSIMVRQKHVKPEGNWCQQCRGTHDKDWIEKITKAAKNRSPEWKALQQKHAREIGTDPLIRKKISATKQGCSLEEWNGFALKHGYCEKFNEPFRERVRAFQGYRCAICGHIWQPGEIRHAVHHVHNKKDSCCNGDSPRLFVILCSRGCHHLTMGREQLFEPRFTRYLMKNFKGKCYYSKEEWDILRKI